MGIRGFRLPSWLTLGLILAVSFGISSNASARMNKHYGDLVLTKTEKSMRKGDVDAVLFPHWFHRIRFRCKVCHEDIFITQQGADNIDMDKISIGEQCGACHDGIIAWDALHCERCHSYPWKQVAEDRKKAQGGELIKLPPKTKKAAAKKPAGKKVAKKPAAKGKGKGKTPASHKKAAAPKRDLNALKQLLFADRAGRMAGTGDPRKPSKTTFRSTLGWQPKAFEAAGLPKDKFGLIDWIKLTREGIIFPKGAREPDDPGYESPVRFVGDPDGDEDIMDILIRVKSDYVAEVVFPHTLHAWWLNCKSCHPKRFVRTAGNTKMTMRVMADGKYCGACHGKVAFPLSDCIKCHDKKKVAECKKDEDRCTFFD